MKNTFLIFTILISFLPWSLKSDEPLNCPSTCQSLYWYKVYNELAEKLRYLSLLAGKSNIIPCSGYFGSGETQIKNFKSEIYFGGKEGWTYDPMKKGKNNGIYHSPYYNYYAYYGYNYWSTNVPTWQDRAGGKTGIYDEGIDVIMYNGGQNCTHPLKNGDKGFSDGSIYYFDNNGNNLWDADEEVWLDSVCNIEMSSLAEGLRGTVYDLFENYYVNPDFQEGDFTAIPNLPYLLKKDEDGNYAQYSLIKLFPEREGEDAYSFTQIPSYLPDGTKIADNPVYSKDGFYSTYNGYFVFPVFFNEVRQILNRNIMRAAWISPTWTNNGENNEKAGAVYHSNTIDSAYTAALNAYNSSSIQRDEYPPWLHFNLYMYRDGYGWLNGKYDLEISRNYSYMGLPKSFSGFQTPKFNAGYYICATAYRNPSMSVFNNGGDMVLENKWCRFAQESPCMNVNVKKKLGTLELPQVNLNENYYGWREEGYYISASAMLMDYDIPPFDIPPFEQESYPASDTNRDDLYDTGIDLNDMNNETGTIISTPDADEPQVILPLRSNNPDSLQYSEYVSIGGMQNKSFILPTILLDGMRFYNFLNPVASPKSDDIGIPLYQSSKAYLFLDLFIYDMVNNIHIKRVGAVRPRGQVVLFDFKWDPANNKFSDIGIPLGIHSKRTYRLVRKEFFDDNTSETWSHYFLQFDSGISHEYTGDDNTHDFIDTAWEDIHPTLDFANLRFKDSTKISRGGGHGIEYVAPSLLQGLNYDIDYEWNDKALLSKLIYKTKDGKSTVEVSLEYDAERKIKKLKKKVPKNMAVDGRTEYEISVNGNTITYPGGISSVKTQTDIAGKARTTVISKNIPDTGTVETTYEYNADDLVTSIKEIANGSSNETTYTYYSGEEKFPNTSKKCQKLKSIVYPDNSWKLYEYDENGWVSKISSPFKSEPLPSENPDKDKCHQEVYSYEVHDYDYDELLTEVIADPINICEFPRTTISYTKEVETARSYYVTDLYQGFYADMYRWDYCDWDWNWSEWYYYNGDECGDQLFAVIRKICTSKNAAWNDQSNLTNIKLYQTKCPYGNILLSSESPTQVTCTEPDVETDGEVIDFDFPNFLTDTRKISEVFSKDNTKLSSIETVTNPRGITWLKKVTDGPSDKIVESSVSTTDSFGRITSTTHIDGTTETFSDYCLYGPQKHIDGNGNITIYTYNALGQVSSEDTPLATITRTYDALGNVTGITTAPKGQGETTSESWAYDSMSRITSLTDSVGKTTYSYNGTTTEINYPDCTNQIIQKNLDGTIASISGSAVSPVTYDYGVDSEKGSWVKEIRDTTWTITYSNMLGQPHRTETSTGYWTQNTYDNAGRLIGSTDSEGRESYTDYNNKNEVASQTVNDRTTTYEHSVTTKEGKTVFKTKATSPGAVGDIVTENETDVSGRNSWSDVNGKKSNSKTALTGNGSYAVENTDIENKTTYGTYGRRNSEITYPTGAKLSSVLDGRGRKTLELDGRGVGANDISYRPGTSQISSQELSDGKKTQITYEKNRFQPDTVRLPGEENPVKLIHDDHGNFKRFNGTAEGIMDATNIYNSLDQQTEIETKGKPGNAKTEFAYYENSGLLKSKTINELPVFEFSYHPDGRLDTLIKNTGAGSGELKTIKYTNAPQLFYAGYDWNNSPAVTISEHNILGLPGKIETAGKCMQTFTYNSDAQIAGVGFSRSSIV